MPSIDVHVPGGMSVAVAGDVWLMGEEVRKGETYRQSLSCM